MHVGWTGPVSCQCALARGQLEPAGASRPCPPARCRRHGACSPRTWHLTRQSQLPSAGFPHHLLCLFVLLQTLVSVSTIGMLDQLSEQQLIDQVKQVRGCWLVARGSWRRLPCGGGGAPGGKRNLIQLHAWLAGKASGRQRCAMPAQSPVPQGTASSARHAAHPPPSACAGAGRLVWRGRGGGLAAPEDVSHPLRAAQPGKPWVAAAVLCFF